MEYCLDGYNIMFKMARLASVNIENSDNFHEFRTSFSNKLADYFEIRHTNAKCYFDGHSNHLIDNTKNIGKFLKIVYVGDVTADEVIIEYIREHQNPRKLIVVTEDHEIASVARAFKCRLIKSIDFINKIPSLAGFVDEVASSRIRKIDIPTKKRKTNKESKPTLRKMNFADIEQKFKNIDMNDILQELAEEDGIDYSD